MRDFLLLIAACLCLEINFAYAQRDPLKWPFAKTSIWNMPIHSNAVYVPGNIQDAAHFEVDEDVIIMTPNEPLMDVKTNYTGWSAGGDARCSEQGPTLFTAPIPQNFIFSNAIWHGNTPNSGASILLTNGKIKQTQPFAKCSNTLATSQYVWNENECELTGECIVGAHGGSHLSAIGGALRVGELTSGQIKHVLKLNLWGLENFYPGNTGHRWPAITADGGFDDPNSGNGYGGTNPELRIGALLAVHKDAVLESVANNSLGLKTEAALILARALQNYGGYTVDNTGWDDYAIITEIGPAGRVSDEFKSLYGYDMNAYGFLDTPWATDIRKLFMSLYVISNNDETNIGGGPTQDFVNRRAPMAPDFLPAPSCTITSPANNLTVNAPASVTIQTSVDAHGGSINKVEFYNGSQKIGEDLTAPYSFTWSNVDEGFYSIHALAINNIYSSGSSGNVSITVNSTDGYIKFTGNGIGSPGSYGNNGLTFAKALDGDSSTFFDGPAADGQWVGLDLGVAKIVKKVKFIPREGWANRLLDGKIQGANNADFSDAIDLYTINSVPPEKIFSVGRFGNTKFFQFYRYLSPNQGYGNISEIEFWGDPNDPVNQPPLTALITPLNNSNFAPGADINLSAIAGDPDGKISKVEFFNGPTIIGSVEKSPYNFLWENVAEGNYQIYAKATDNAGVTKNSVSALISVSNKNTTALYAENFDANTSLGWVANGGAWNANNNRFESSDWNGEFTSFYDSTSFSNYTYSLDAIPNWDNNIGFIFNYNDINNYYLLTINGKSKSAEFKKNVNGSWSTLATATFTGNGTGSQHHISINNTGSETTITVNQDTVFNKITTTDFTGGKIGLYSFYCPSSFDNIVVSSNNLLPSVEITSPLSNSNFKHHEKLKIKVAASDPDGTINKVALFDGAKLIGSDTLAPFKFVLPHLASGTHYFTAIATDNNGSARTSSVVKVNVGIKEEPTLNLTSLCSDDILKRRWRVTSTFHKTITFQWNVYNTPQTGYLIVGPEDEVIFETNAVEGPNTTIITFGKSEKVVKASGNAICDKKISQKIIKDGEISVTIYPNPSEGRFNVAYNGFSNPLVTISNMEGKIMYRKKATNSQPEEILENLKKGMYILTVSDAKHFKHTKFIIQ